jgi:hypothetical protein
LFIVGMVAALLAPLARADADPASDVLPAQDVFLPYATILSGHLKPSDNQLIDTVAMAKRAGYPVKVAVIASSQDLGGVTGLNGKPETYARFLGQELSFLYHGPLLVVMQRGFGLYDGGRSVSRDERLLRSIAMARTSTGLEQAATAAVVKLAAAAHHPFRAPPARSSDGGTAFDRAVIAGGGAALLTLLVGFTLVWWSRLRRGRVA